MAVSGISTALPVQGGPEPIHQRSEKFKQEFHQLGRDLRSGDLAAAQADFATIQEFAPECPSTQGQSLLGKAFDRLADDLQAGDFASAKQDYSTIHQIFRSRAQEQGGGIGRMVDHSVHQVRSGNLAPAQQAYSAVQNALQRFAEADNGLTDSKGGMLSTNA